MSKVAPSTVTITASDIIKRALRILKQYAPGEPIPGEEITDNLSSLNALLDHWSLSGLIINALTVESKALTALTAVYTIGSGGDFDTERPVGIIENASYIRDSSGEDTPLIKMTESEYSSVSPKTQTSGTIPSRIWYNPKYPLGDIVLDPAPSSGLTLYLAMEKPFYVFDDISTDIAMQPGYRSALEYNLAVWLADEYDAVITPAISTLAVNTKAAIEARNFKPLKKESLGIPAGGQVGISDRSAFLGGRF